MYNSQAARHLSYPFPEADLGMFMLGPTKGGPMGQRMLESSVTFSGLLASLWPIVTFKA